MISYINGVIGYNYYINGIIQTINGVMLILITGITRVITVCFEAFGPNIGENSSHGIAAMGTAIQSNNTYPRCSLYDILTWLVV